MKKISVFLGLFFAVASLFLFSCKQEGDDTDVNVYTDEKYYTYYYKASNGTVNYTYTDSNGYTYNNYSTPLSEGVVKVYWTSYTNSNFTCYNLDTDISFTYLTGSYSYSTKTLGEVSIYKVGSSYYLEDVDGTDVTNYVSGLGENTIEFKKMPLGDDFYLTLTLTRY